jgi:GNAT superfamily N-acetyltransferase
VTSRRTLFPRAKKALRNRDGTLFRRSQRQAFAMHASPSLNPPQPPHPLLEIADWIEQAALQDMYLAATPSLRRSAGLFVERVAGALTVGAPGIASSMVSRVFVQPGGSADVAGAAVERMRKAGVRQYLAHVHRPESGELAPVLAERGLVRFRRAWVKLARDRAPLAQHGPSAPEGDIQLCAAQREQSDVFAELIVRCMQVDGTAAELLSGVVQRPRWHVYFATLGGQPIATGALFVQGDVAYLGYGATLPEHRGQGLQRMLLAKRIRVALALGCRWIISETGEAIAGEPSPSLDNMQALGMLPIATRDNYVLEGVRWS